MDSNQTITTTKTKMHKALEIIKNDLGTIRTGRATPALVENISVAAYDGTTRMKLSEMATITTSDARTLVISPFDTTQIGSIEKSILEANVGLTPIVDGVIVRLTIPTLTEERRQEYLKLAKAKIEAGRIMVRQIRHDIMAEIKRAFESERLNEDEKKHLENEIQKITDTIVNDINLLSDKKEQDLLQI